MAAAPPKPVSPTKPNPLLFIKEVAKYFMDFLETDFHRRQTPKRAVRFRNPDNLLVGVALTKYPSFTANVWKLIGRNFAKGILDHVEKGVYKTSVPENLLELIRLQVTKISEAQLSKIINSVTEELQNAVVLYAKEYDKALTTVIETASAAIKSELVLPLIGSLEKPLQNLELCDENTVYLMEEELTSILTELLVNKISELLRLVIGKLETNVSEGLGSVFELTDIKSKVSSFFEALQVGDLFAELFEMERNRNILDKQDFYLYFCDITFNRAKYPIFYIPIAVERQGDVLKLEFDAQVYINKRALDYIVQEVNQLEQKRGSLKTTTERIIYLAQHEHDFRNLVSGVLTELTNVFELDRSIDIRGPALQVAKSRSVRISNTCYAVLFDKSDESLVNDYEEILQILASGSDNPLAETFNKLIEDFIHKDPISFNGDVEEEWDSSSPSDKLVFESPIPLNSEQRQILAALNKEGCRFVTVEGPPGTGKSHTITAVLFAAILKDQSVLVLSDKKEALDVVEDKITETMNQVRYDRHFQNPILRLGRTGSTYGQILSTASIENIKTHYRAVRKEHENIEQDISKSANSLKEDLEAEIIAYGEIDPREIRELAELERNYEEHGSAVDVGEIIGQEEGPPELEELRTVCRAIRDTFLTPAAGDRGLARLLQLLGWQPGIDSTTTLGAVLQAAVAINDAVKKVEKRLGDNRSAFSLFRTFSKNGLEALRHFLRQYEECRNKLFGYLFTRHQVAALDAAFAGSFQLNSAEPPHKVLPALKAACDEFTFVANLQSEVSSSSLGRFDLVAAVHEILTREGLRAALERLATLEADYTYLQTTLLLKYPRTLQNLGISGTSVRTLSSNNLTEMVDSDFERLLRYLNLEQILRKEFNSIPPLSYANELRGIEGLVTIQMTYLLDGRVIDFSENSRATAKALQNIIRSKQRFPKEEFGKLKKAFPCILAGIRDYAEYIPLEPDLFDLLIIDEASQVSIAQAFPALLRAKRILILGDRKQFSNIKAAQARTATNREYLNTLEDVFKTHVSRDATKLVRLSKFDIRTSILEFFEFIKNYHTQLLKHFRGYKELISYSDKYFYRNLQVMKIRGKAIDDVLKFTILPHDGKAELIQNSNKIEIEYVIGELKKLKDSKTPVSVGIITPHTNQQKLLMESISRLPEWDYFRDELKLKIMTFDTCQGEERDLIFYSMVARKEDDRLWGVFIKDLKDVDLEEEGRIKAQRLNVGFSRARECMHFVLSKDLTGYSGSIGEALRHYWQVLDESRKERSVSEVDEKSQMEPVILNWFYQTPFWHENQKRLELIPQFEIGKYLKQLDITYSHPKYRVDFLLVYRGDTAQDQKIIMEYDGFREHFQDLPGINATNYQEYYSDEHVYREKVLEGYGYKFLRINRFNVGENPIATLDQRLRALVEKGGDRVLAIANIHSTIAGLQNGNLKECPKCKTLRNLDEFRDPSLVSGYGRFCGHCKAKPKAAKPTRRDVAPAAPLEVGPKPCPRCGSRMLLRKGRYGKFYGCSRYPYCRATRQVEAR